MQYLLISFFICLIALLLILNTRIANVALDTPNQRSLHTKLTPRTGGLAIMAGVLISWLFMPINLYWILFPLSLMLISLMDDVYHLSVKWRFLMQLMASAAFILAMLPPQAWWLVALLTLLITWMTNLYNFMDGSDGLAGGMGLFGFASYAIAAYIMGDMHLAAMNAAVSSACLAFLFFNFNPAKIFMGDSGSIPLGFLAGSIGAYGCFYALWPVWFPLLVFSPFIIDATVTLFKRQLAGEKVWQAHRSHYYQHLVRLGWGHRNTALAEYMLMISLAASAILLLKESALIVFCALLFWAIAYLIMMRWIDKRWVQIN
ncbi:Rfe UDP-N-acetylmuramyl pentapeptide phosphotransferase/UDP-N- acetylglucosamine-1-phosphate transferase [Methylophilaceae bacterium]